MKLTLDEDGSLIYNLGILSDTENIYVPLEIVLESENEIMREKISLFEYTLLQGKKPRVTIIMK